MLEGFSSGLRAELQGPGPQVLTPTPRELSGKAWSTRASQDSAPASTPGCGSSPGLRRVVGAAYPPSLPPPIPWGICVRVSSRGESPGRASTRLQDWVPPAGLAVLGVAAGRGHAPREGPITHGAVHVGVRHETGPCAGARVSENPPSSFAPGCSCTSAPLRRRDFLSGRVA